MSKTRRPDENLESPDAIRAFFQKLAEGGASAVGWHEVWLALVTDLWVRAEVLRRARHYAADHQLSEEEADDIAQTVFLLLAKKLADDPTMHVRAELLPDSFCGWLGTIIEHLCSDAARHARRYRRPPGELPDGLACQGISSAVEVVLDVADAVARLEGRERSVVLLYLNGLSREQIAKTLALTYKEVIGAFNRAKPRLQKLLAAYRD